MFGVGCNMVSTMEVFFGPNSSFAALVSQVLVSDPLTSGATPRCHSAAGEMCQAFGPLGWMGKASPSGGGGLRLAFCFRENWRVAYLILTLPKGTFRGPWFWG